MRGTHTALVVCSLVGLLVGVAHAQPPPPPPPPPPPGGGGPAPSTEPVPTRWVGLGLVLIPTGTLAYEAMGQSDSESLASAYGIELLATRAIAPNLQFVVSPRFLSGIKGQTGTESANQLDLRMGLSFTMPLSPGLVGFGYGAAGWSMIFPPDTGGESYTPMGPIFGGGAGIAYALGPRLLATGSLGYQLGFQKATIQGTSVTLKDNILDFTLGILVATG